MGGNIWCTIISLLHKTDGARFPFNAICRCALTQPAFAFMLVTVKTTLCTSATFSSPL